MENKFGALPPDGVEWQVGKTAASIRFVKDAEFAIKHLQEMVDKIKSGELYLDNFVDVSVPQEFKFKYIEHDYYKIEPVFKKRPKKKVVLVPVELDGEGEGMAEGCWWVVRDAETNEPLGFLPTHSNGPVITGPDRHPCPEFDIEVVDIGD